MCVCVCIHVCVLVCFVFICTIAGLSSVFILQDSLGEIVYVQLPEIGTEVEQDGMCLKLYHSCFGSLV